MSLSRNLVPDLATLQAFEAAARYGSFTQAATELALTQSAISRQVKDLETRLGLQLFERVRQRVILSDAGRRLLPEARLLLSQAESLTMRAIGSRDLTGVLRVATLPTFGTRWLLPRLPGFLAANPQVQVTLFSRPAPFDLAADPFDLAIHFGKPVWPHGTCTYLCREEILPVASSRLLGRAGGGDLLIPEQIAALPLLHLETRPKLWAEWHQAQGLPAGASAFAGHRFDQFAMVIEAARIGMGAGLVPRYLIERELAEGHLVPLSPRPLHTDGAYYLVAPEGRSQEALTARFQDWLLKELGPARLARPA